MTDTCFDVHTDGELTVCNHGTVMVNGNLLGVIRAADGGYEMYHPFKNVEPITVDTLKDVLEEDQLLLNLGDRIGIPADHPKRKKIVERTEDANRVIKAIESFAAWHTTQN